MNTENTARTASTIESIIFQPYNAKIPPTASNGSRISKVMYKAAVIGGKASKDNAYLELPCISTAALQAPEVLAQFIPHFVSYLEGVQDSITKRFHKDSVSRVSVSSFNLDHLLDHLEAEGVSGRMTNEVVKAWFNSELEDKLCTAFFSKMGLQEDSAGEEEIEKVLAVVNAYRIKFVSLASGRTRMIDSDIEMLLAVLGKVCAESNDVTTNRIKARLLKMQDQDDSELLEAL